MRWGNDEREELNSTSNYLVAQVRALDSESIRTEDREILEWALVAIVMAVGAHFFVGTILVLYGKQNTVFTLQNMSRV